MFRELVITWDGGIVLNLKTQIKSKENCAIESSSLNLVSRNLGTMPWNLSREWESRLGNNNVSVKKMPVKLIVEISNTCNLDCPMCRVGRYGVDLKRVMSISFFKKIASELFNEVESVRINGLGEATIVPGFQNYLDIIDRYNVSKEIITNLTADVEIYKRLVLDRFTILISWDAASEKLYNILRRPANFKIQFKKLSALGSYARSLFLHDNLHMMFTLMPLNINELQNMVNLALECGVPNIVVNVIKTSTDIWSEERVMNLKSILGSTMKKANEAGIRLFIPDHLGKFNLYSPSGERPIGKKSCDRPFKEALIRYNGDVQVCNMFNPYTYGNILNASFSKLWQGKFASLFREMLDTEFIHPYCRGCYYLGDVYERKKDIVN